MLYSQDKIEMKLNKYSNIEFIKNEWEYLYENNYYLTPFQSFEWNLLQQNKFNNILNRLTRLFKGLIKIEYLVFKDNSCTIIAPIIIYYKGKSIYIFGQQDLPDYLSFIFSSDTPIANITYCIKWIKAHYSQFTLVLDRINESNKSMQQACYYSNHKNIIEKKCIQIPIVNNLKEKINSDSRRYLKKAKDRIELDQLSLTFDFSNNEINCHALAYLHDFYIERNFNKFNSTRKNRIKRRCIQFIYNRFADSNDLVSQYLVKNSNIFFAGCYINNELSAYMICTQRDQTMYVLRISIDDRYDKYRPGIILIVETISYLFNKDDKLKYIDFSRGDESYKLNYGGVVHYNYCFSM
jgi:hypothetical protein